MVKPINKKSILLSEWIDEIHENWISSSNQHIQIEAEVLLQFFNQIHRDNSFEDKSIFVRSLNNVISKKKATFMSKSTTTHVNKKRYTFLCYQIGNLQIQIGV